MLFQQYFDLTSHAFSYLLADGPGGEAIIIDPVDRDLDRYLAALDHYALSPTLAIDTHLHADHVSAAAALRARTGCATAMGEHTRAHHPDRRLRDGEPIALGNRTLTAIATPGHTEDSICLAMSDRVFTGDTLFVGATGRTDLPGDDSLAQFEALHQRLLALPDDTLVYPGHDYLGATASTIGRERRGNPRLQCGTAQEYATLMAGLELPRPRAMEFAIPANMHGGGLPPVTAEAAR